jgi:hypothetical protein
MVLRRAAMAHRIGRSYQRRQGRYGLNRCRYRREDGMKRSFGLGVIADNLIDFGQVIGKRSSSQR